MRRLEIIFEHGKVFFATLVICQVKLSIQGTTKTESETMAVSSVNSQGAVIISCPFAEVVDNVQKRKNVLQKREKRFNGEIKRCDRKCSGNEMIRKQSA